MYIDTTPKRRKYSTTPPKAYLRTPGRTLSERKQRLTKQLDTINKLLECTRAHKARASLNESRNALLNSIAFIDAQEMRIKNGAIYAGLR